MKPDTFTHADVVRTLKERQGKRSLRVFSRELGISPQNLSDIYTAKHGLSTKLLEKLGLEKSVLYRAAAAKRAAGARKQKASKAVDAGKN